MKTTQTYQGKPCKRAGHTKRYVKSGACVVCKIDAEIKRFVVKKEKRKAKNPDNNTNKYQGDPCEKGHTERYVISEQCVTCQKAYDKKRHSENIVSERARMKQYQLDNLNVYRHNTAKRRKRVKEQTPPWADMEKIKQIYLTCPNGYDVDHIHPLSKGGLHIHWNLQHLPAIENLRKGSKIL
tara:strand:+ start:77 stop:622 length:546 start_codon:yes stop_codon:yes gene_type:complete